METKILFILIGMSIVTIIPRILPVVILSRVNLPPLLRRWLQYIPVAVLSALLFPALFIPEGTLTVQLAGKPVLASIPCFLVAIRTRNLFLTVLTGIAAMFLLQQL